jgi:hypothetical protein
MSGLLHFVMLFPPGAEAVERETLEQEMAERETVEEVTQLLAEEVTQQAVMVVVGKFAAVTSIISLVSRLWYSKSPAKVPFGNHCRTSWNKMCC